MFPQSGVKRAVLTKQPEIVLIVFPVSSRDDDRKPQIASQLKISAERSSL